MIKARAKAAHKKDPSKVIARVTAPRLKDPDAVRDRNYRRMYGITVQQYEHMLKEQNGKCKLCGRPPKSTRLNIDHCHKTKRVRGLLCFRCNKFLIGRWRAEHAVLLRLASEYLESNFDGRNLKL